MLIYTLLLPALPHLFPHLILTSRTLTSLQLIQIPPTNRQTPAVLIHALPEIRHLVRAHARRRLVRHGAVCLFGLRGLGLDGGRGRGGAAAEEAADGVTD